MRAATSEFGTSLPSTDVRSTAAPGGDPDIEPTPPEGRLHRGHRTLIYEALHNGRC